MRSEEWQRQIEQITNAKYKKHKLKQITKRCRSKKLCTAFTISFYNPTPQRAKRFCGGRTCDHNVGDGAPYIMVCKNAPKRADMQGLTDDRHGRPEVAPTQFDKQISSGTTTSSPIFYSKIFFHCNISVKNIHLYYDGRQGGSDWTKREEKSSQNLR